ncbi:FG-GAP-like repeat-containing protein [Streptomyces sp. NBC_01320]|uniref:FG-GAP-like repeat-containing protein n=1 Tax=Streptomyces sp. NBC_01320 TaxID=2903824 RepID=UPI002E15A7A3|nr:FG-GAP-like repeat-containing protein [Streptomyces sp. NBC_01320]
MTCTLRIVNRTALAAAVVLGAIGLPASPAAFASSTRSGSVRSVAVPGTGPGLHALPARTTEPFSMVGVTWDDRNAQLGGVAQVRTRADGTWSGWRPLDTDVRTPEVGSEHTKAGVRGGTQPLWTGPSDGVQVRISGKHLPAGLRVELVDPNSGAPTTRSVMSATGATAAGQPAVTPRSGWGADESMVADPPTYMTDTKAVFVHHTAGTNSYTCAQSPDIIRGIFNYHVQSEGWNDIGYHFLVDKCGTVFEGRAGGIDKPVQGAHTYGFNTDTSSISVLGDYNTATTNPAVRESIAKVAAWKLGLYGINPAGTVVLTAAAANGKYTAGQKVTLNRISGHRDGYPTECPGNNLYADLPAIRTLAQASNSPARQGDFNGEGHADLAVGVPKANQVTVVPGGRSGPYAANRIVLGQETSGVPDATEAGDEFGAATAYGDLDHDGFADLVVSAPGEELSDGANDEGALTVLRGSANGLSAQANLISPKRSGERFGSAVATGDFNGDGGADILAVAPGSGRAYPVDGADQTIGLPAELAQGAVQDAAVATGDFDHDGYADAALTFRTAAGTTPLVVLNGSADGLRTDAPIVLDSSGGRSLATGDLNGDGFADLAVGRPTAGIGGEVATYHGSSTGLTAAGGPVITQGTGSGDGDALGTSIAVGDTDADGYADLLAGIPGADLSVAGAEQADAGAVLLAKGGPDGLTTTATYNTDQPGVAGAAEAGDRLGSAVALADFTGDGYADLGIGSDGENAGDGTVLTLNGAPSGVVASSGLYYGPTALGVTTGSNIGDVLAP